MIEGRDLSGLTYVSKETNEPLYNELDIRCAFQAIIDLFGLEYLSSPKDHRLPKLWKRIDRLSTFELFMFGQSLVRINQRNDCQDWLKRTASAIKRQSKDITHGFFTEVLFLGISSYKLLKTDKYYPIIPAPNSNPIYDFKVRLTDDLENVISIKNIDISNAQINFQANCELLLKTWKEVLKKSSRHLSLVVSSDKYISEAQFKLIINHIQATQIDAIQSTFDSRITLRVKELPIDNYFESNICTSHLLQVLCPPHESELKRYILKIRNAVNDLKKYIPSTKKCFRTLFLRAHVHANYVYIQNKVDSLLYEEDCGIDCIIFYQPSYSRAHDGKNILLHCLHIAVIPEKILELREIASFGVNFPIGYFSENKSNVVLRNGSVDNDIHLSPDTYFFQKGCIYLEELECEATNDLAVGIKMHMVKDGVVIPNYHEPEDAALLII